MSARFVEGNAHGEPLRVFHRHGKAAWTHGYAAECEPCAIAGHPRAVRAASLATYWRVRALVLAAETGHDLGLNERG